MSGSSGFIFVTYLFVTRYYLEVAVGDEIRLVDPITDCHGDYVVDNSHESYIIVNPDWLIGATTIADGVTCLRRYVHTHTHTHTRLVTSG